ncbi:hypothetical protein [Flavivirga spongiicola]|uniref:Lipoprotein n=1 Tax=Flavivirga spongiicola TaxID=421621 RepID=A0ABU7XMW5_9FLAO|nr:hypothetical protein [Flavivirga sp. MEBiC05379]MDO5981544.1 hypothetical protein [Flavivirga sp. MEBiC05379]
MKKIYILFVCIIVFSCGNEKVILLPEINHSDITEINDVSPAYLFYDKTKKDSIELNRKNLISTTNWLINVDKRLTLKQAIPHIKFLQDKKQNSSHKNKDAKNYFTCNDTSRKNLGFIEFTNVVYHEGNSISYFSKISDIPTKKRVNIIYNASQKIEIHGFNKNLTFKVSNDKEFLSDVKSFLNSTEDIEIVIEIKDSITFQSYITLKSHLLKIAKQNVSILNDEFITN